MSTENEGHNLSVLRVCEDDDEANIIIGFLQANGIEAMLDSNLQHDVLPVEEDARVFVNEDDAERARDLLDARETEAAKEAEAAGDE